MGKLFSQIKEIAEVTTPMHMPGHKRNQRIYKDAEGEYLHSLFRYDLTEIHGTDDLHAPEGILKEAQERAARLYDTMETFFLVNGSTAGVLTAISAAIPFGGKLLMPRCSHKSVYHACGLRHITPCYLENKRHPLLGFDEGCRAEEVEKKLKEEPDIAGVLVTSPTYEGRLLPLKEIAETVHAAGKVLIVDSAHGAHDIVHATKSGADLVIHSLHKTLPAPTQTGLLHICSDRVSLEKIKYYLRVYQTSSPSYPFMIAMDSCISWLSEKGKEAENKMRANRKKLAEGWGNLHVLKVLDAYQGDETDCCKLVLYTKCGTKGPRLAEELRKRAIEPELTAPGYVLLIMTACEPEEVYRKLAAACQEIDAVLAEEILPEKTEQVEFEEQAEFGIHLHEAVEKETEKVLLGEAAGKICGQMISLYPPGQPMIVPGEKFTEGLIKRIQKMLQMELNVTGVTLRNEPGLYEIQVVKEV